AELGRALRRDGHAQAIRSGLRSLDAETDAAERVHSGRFWKDEAVGLDGTFVRAGKEVCLFLCGMSDPRPDVTIDLSPGNPCRRRRNTRRSVDPVELQHRRVTWSASNLATIDPPVVGDLDGGEGRERQFIKDFQTADELLPGAGENLLDRVVHTTRQ